MIDKKIIKINLIYVKLIKIENKKTLKNNKHFKELMN